MAKEEKKEGNDDEIVAVGEGAENPDTPVVDEDQEGDGEEGSENEDSRDERIGQSETDDDEGEGKDDEGKDDEGRQAIKARRRIERRNQRQRIARERRELDFLRERNETVERQLSQLVARQDQSESTQIDQRIGQLETSIRQAQQVHSKAIEKGNGEAATEALSLIDGFNTHLSKLREAKVELGKRSTKKEESQEERGEPTSQIDPEIKAQYTAWADRNTWFDRKTLADADSRLAQSIEAHLSTEDDYDPADPEYWRELDRRVARAMPHLRKETDKKETPAPKRKPGGPRFATGGRERSLKPNEVYIDAERRKALEEAGLWNDPETRDRYLRSYKKYDEEARNNS